MTPDAHSTKDGTIDRMPLADVPHHPRISDALARAAMNAIVDCDCVGIALLRGRPWVHVLVNATYQEIVGVSPTLGRAATSILPPELASNAMLEEVLSTGRTVSVREAALHDDHPGDEPRSYASLTFLPVRAPDGAGDDGAVLVLARDVTEQVHERRTGKLFVLLAEDIASGRDTNETIRTAVSRAVEALDADTASIFLLSADGKRLDGAIVGWDWTRSSFSVDLTTWPTVRAAIKWQAAVYVPHERARDAERGWFEKRGIAATVCAPMCTSGRVEGVLFFDFEQRPIESNVDLAVAKRVADQCALVLTRAAADGARAQPIVGDSLVHSTQAARAVLDTFLEAIGTTQSGVRERDRNRDQGTLLDEAVRTVSIARDLLRTPPDERNSFDDNAAFVDVASLVRAASASLRRTADGIGGAVLAWTPAVALAMIAAPLLEEVFLETAHALIVWAGDGGHLSTSVLTVGARVQIVLVATAINPRDPFELPEHTREILERRGGNASAEPDEGISTRITLLLPGVEIRK